METRMQKSTSGRNNFSKRRLAGLLFASATAGLALSSHAQAQSAYTGGSSGTTGMPVTGDWNTAGNWSPVGVPANTSASTILSFGGSTTAYTSTDDIAGMFTLNQLQFNSSVGTNYINASSGSSLNFSAGAIISQAGTGGFQINAPLNLSGGFVTISGTASGAVTLGGAIGGSGGISYTNSTSGAYLRLVSANTFTGGVNVSGGTYTYIASPTALGTGTFTALGSTYLDTTQLAVGSTVANAMVLPGSGYFEIYANGAAGSTIFSGNFSGGSTSTELYLNTNVGNAAAIFEFSNANSTFVTSTSPTSGIILNRGTLRVDSAKALGNASNGVYLDSYSPNDIIFGGSFTYTHPTEIDYATSSWNTSTNTVTATGPITGSVAINKIGTGELILAGSNTYGSATTVTTVSSGLLVGASPAAFPYFGTKGLISVASGATLGGMVGGTGDFSTQLDTLRTSETFAAGSYFGIDTTNGNFTYTGDLGSGTTGIALNKLGANTLTLSANQSYTGGTLISAGSIGLGINNALLSGSTLTIDNRTASSSFALNGFNQTIGAVTLYAGNSNRTAISGTGTLQLTGNVTLIDSHTSGQDYPLTIAAPIDLNGATRTFTLGYGANNDSSDLGDLHISGVISTSSGTAGIIIAPQSSTYAGTLTLQAANTYNGPTTLETPSSLYLAVNNALPNGSAFIQQTGTTLDLTAAGSKPGGISTGIGSLTGAGTIKLGTSSVLTVGYDNTSPAAYAGTISGTGGGITKTGTGALIFSAPNTYTGPTVINGGRLEVDSTLASSTVTVNSGGTLNGLGVLAGAVTVNNGGSITAGISGSGNLTLASLQLRAVTGDAVSLNVTSTANIVDNGIFNLASGATAVVNVGGGATAYPAGTNVPLLTYNSSATSTVPALSLGTLPNRVQGQLVFIANGNNTETVAFDATASDFPVWTGNSSNLWNTTDSNWVLNSNNATAVQYNPGDAVLFSDLGAGHTTVNINGADVFPSAVTFNTSLNYTLGGTNGINGSTGLVVSGNSTGSGSLTINNINSFTGGVNVSNATLSIASLTNAAVPSPIGAGTLVSLSSGGTLLYTGSNASTNRVFQIGAGGGTFNVSNSASTLSIGSLSGTGTLTVAGPGTLALTAAGTGFTGPIVVNSSNLSVSADTQLGAVPAAVTPAAITLNGTGVLNVSGSFALNANRGITGSGSVVVSNGSTLSMGGSNSYTGGTVLLGGSGVAISNINALSTGPIVVGTVNAGGTFLDVSGLGAVTAAIANNITLPADTSGTTHTLYSNGSTGNVVRLNGNITGGGSGTELLLNTATASAAGIFEFNGSGSNFVTSTSPTAGIVLNRGSLQVDTTNGLGNAANPVYFDSYSPNSLIFGGSITYAHPTTLAYATSTWNTGSYTVTASGPITGSVGINEVGGGTLILTGANSYTAATTVSAGTLQVGNGGTTGNLPAYGVSIASGANLKFNRSDSVAFTGAISGAGSVTQTGPGRLILTAANTYTGNTNVNGGTLEVDGSLASPTIVNASATLTGTGTLTGPVTLNNGATIAATGVLTVGGLTFGAVSSDLSTVTIGTTFTPNGSSAGMIVDNGLLTTNSGNNTVTLNVAGAALPAGTYPLIAYNGSAGSNFSFGAFKMGTVPAGDVATIVNDTTNHSIDLNVSFGDYPKWTGALNSEWVTTVQSLPKNWQYNSANTPTDYVDGEQVLFDDSASNFNVDISNGNVSPNSVIFNNGSQTYNFTGVNGIAGAASVTMLNQGTVIFNNLNTYTGDTIIGNGTIVANNSSNGTAGPLGVGTIRLGNTGYNGNNAVFGLGVAGGTGGISVSNPIVVQNGSTGTLTIASQSNSGINTLTGPVTLSNSLTVLSAAGGELDFNGNISSGTAVANLTINDNNNNTGTVRFNGSLKQGGSITVNSGSVYSAGSLTATAINVNGGTLNVSGGVTTTNTSSTTGTGITLNNGAIMTASGTVNAGRYNPINIGGNSIFQSAGTLDLLVSQSTAIGNVEVSGGGTLQLTGTGHSYSTPDIYFASDQVSNTYYGATITAGTLDLGSTQRFIVANNGHNSVANYLYPAASPDAFITSNIIGSAGFNYQGKQYGTTWAPLVLDGSNTFSGPVEIDSGSVYLYSQDAWDGQNQLTLNNSAGAGTSYSHFFLLGNNATITNLASAGLTPGNTGIANSNVKSGVPGSANPATLTINETTNTTFGGTINDGLTDNYDGGQYSPGSLSVVITGTGTLTLGGVNTYSGATTVGVPNASSNPSLIIAPGGSLANTAVTVNSHATLMIPPGSKIGSTTSAGASLTLNQNSVLDLTAGGTSTAVGNLSIQAPPNYAGNNLLSFNGTTINMNASVTNPDTITSVGAASVSGTNIININLVGTSTALPSTYNIITAPSGLTGTFEFNNGTGSETLTYNGQPLQLALINTDRDEELTINGGAQAPLNAYFTNNTGTLTWNSGGNNGLGATNFSNDSQGTMDPHYLPGPITNVIFSSSSSNVPNAPFTTTLGQDFTINSIEFASNANNTITVAGSNTLTIGSGGILVDPGSAAHNISTGALVIGQDQTWTNNSINPLTITSNVSGGNLTVAGSGTIVLTANNNTYASTTINAGATLQLGNGGASGNVSAGTLTDNGSLAFNHPGNTNYNASGITGTGNIVQAGPGVLTIGVLPPSTIGFGVTAGTLVLPSVNLTDTPNNFVGNGGTLVSNGTMDVGTFDAAVDNIISINAGGTLISNGNLILNGNANRDHTTIAGPGTLVLNNSTGSISNPDLMSSVINNTPYGTGISAAIQLSAGTHYVGGTSGNDSYGQYNDGDVFLLGSLSGPGNLDLYGLPYNSQFELRLGADNSNWTGALTITGGDIALTATNALTANNSVTFNPPLGVTNHGTTLVSALYLFGNNITIGSLSGTGAGGMFIRDGAATTAATLTVDQTVAGTFAGNISDGPNDYYSGKATTGSLGITKTGPATLTLSGSNTYTGPTNVTQGQLIFARTGTGIQTANMPGGLTIGSGAVATVAIASSQSNRTLMVLGGLSLAGTSGAWTSKLDLGNNDVVVNNGSLSLISNQVAQGYAGGSWNGTGGIMSTAAATDATYLHALGVIQNSVDGTPGGTALYSNSSSGSLGLFDHTYAGANSDVLIKYTYYGDTNLDGQVDGTDYSRIDTSYGNEAWVNGVMTGAAISGWYNGDFNYDGVVDGSDYTLMDNAFNSQGAQISAAVATAQIAATVGGSTGGSAVPEPASLGLIGITAMGLLGRRARRRH
jgi:autotransporter-associated beta strand protein